MPGTPGAAGQVYRCPGCDQLNAHRDNVLTDLSGLHDRLRGVIEGVGVADRGGW